MNTKELIHSLGLSEELAQKVTESVGNETSDDAVIEKATLALDEEEQNLLEEEKQADAECEEAEKAAEVELNETLAGLDDEAARVGREVRAELDRVREDEVREGLK
jgi:hypothetical protein